jgi:hypothetical protein
MSEQTSLAIQLNDEEIDILENDYDRYEPILIVKFVLCFFSVLRIFELIVCLAILLNV